MEVKTNVVSLLRKALENGLSVFQEEQKLKIKVAQGIVPDPEIIGLLKANKEEIIAFLKDGMGGAEDMKTFGEPILPMDRSNPDQRIPLSFSQEQLWFIDQLGGSMQYHQPLALRIKNRLDKQILEESLLALVDRHETLRTVVKSEDGRPYQEI
ncbi:MAG TPA: condensation domain-containing protein, partial [Flavilitoribacter sp.]|nr:condensation domain-containing protein [Flavilitoribacter sp.]